MASFFLFSMLTNLVRLQKKTKWYKWKKKHTGSNELKTSNCKPKHIDAYLKKNWKFSSESYSLGNDIHIYVIDIGVDSPEVRWHHDMYHQIKCIFMTLFFNSFSRVVVLERVKCIRFSSFCAIELFMGFWINRYSTKWCGRWAYRGVHIPIFSVLIVDFFLFRFLFSTKQKSKQVRKKE